MNTITFYKSLKDNGIEYYKPVPTSIKIVGTGLIVFGLSTTFVPFTTIPSIALGSCLIFGLSYKQAKEKYENIKLRYKLKLGFEK